MMIIYEIDFISVFLENTTEATSTTSTTNSDSSDGAIPIFRMCLALFGPLLVILFSIRLKLQIESKLIVSLIRSIVQLLLAGFIIVIKFDKFDILNPIFGYYRLSAFESNFFYAKSCPCGFVSGRYGAHRCIRSHCTTSPNLSRPLL